jgi:hypothetical protein
MNEPTTPETPKGEASIGEAVTEEDRIWLDVLNNAIKNMASCYDEPAKQLITISGVLQGLYFVAISFSTLKDQMLLNCTLDYILIFVFILPVILWLGSLYFAIRVLMPKFRPKISMMSTSEIQQRWQEDRDSKSQNLKRAQWFLVIGFIPLIICIFCYLIFFHSDSSSLTISIK